jgi:hypothetical protein
MKPEQKQLNNETRTKSYNNQDIFPFMFGIKREDKREKVVRHTSNKTKPGHACHTSRRYGDMRNEVGSSSPTFHGHEHP